MRKNNYLFWAIFAVSLVIGLWLYFTTPAGVPVPVHINAHGEVDGYGSRFAGTLLFPLVILGIGLLLIYLDRIDPLSSNVKLSRKALIPLLDGVALFMLFIQIVFAWLIKTGRNRVNPEIFLVGLGLFFIFIGNYLPAMKRNFFVGIRSPWTLASDEVWRATHRLGGWAFVLLGIWTIIVGLTGLGSAWWLVPMFVVVIYVGIIYPFWKFKKVEKERGKSAEAGVDE